MASLTDYKTLLNNLQTSKAQNTSGTSTQIMKGGTAVKVVTPTADEWAKMKDATKDTTLYRNTLSPSATKTSSSVTAPDKKVDPYGTTPTVSASKTTVVTPTADEWAKMKAATSTQYRWF